MRQHLPVTLTSIHSCYYIHFSIPDGVPNPVLFNASSISATSVLISLAVGGTSNTLNPKTIRYQIKYRPMQTSQDFETSPLLPYHTTRYIVTGLSPSLNYEFFVVAENAAGFGPLGRSQIPDEQGEESRKGL